MSNPRYEENIERLVNAHSDITTAILQKGGTVTRSDGFENFASDIRTIPQEGGGGVVQSRNFVKVTATEASTQYGITFTPDPLSGIIDIDGSCVAADADSISFTVVSGTWKVPDGTYKLYVYPVTTSSTVSPTDGLYCGYSVYTSGVGTGDSAAVDMTQSYTMIDDGIAFTSSNDGISIQLTIKSSTAVTFNHAKIKIMLMDNADTSTDYEPYTLNNLELTEYGNQIDDESVKAVKVGSNAAVTPDANGVVSLPPYPSTSGLTSGIKINSQTDAFTPDTNGVITINADTYIGSNSTNNSVPTSEAVYDAIPQKTNIYNVTSTTEVATPRCVYNAFDLILEGNSEIGNKFEYDIDRFRKLNADWTWDRNIAYKNGATVTCNYDGTIRVETTASTTSEFRFYLEKYTIKQDPDGTAGPGGVYTEDLWFRGCPPDGESGGSSSTTGYWLEAIGSDGSSYYDNGSGTQNIYGRAEGTIFNIAIRFKQASLDKLFKPIIVNWKSQFSTGTNYDQFIPNIPTFCDMVGATTELVDFGPKNNVWLDLNELKSLNTSGTWSNNIYTWLNVQFTFDDTDGTISVTSNGQPVGQPSGSQSKVVFVFKDKSGISLRGMMLSGCPANDLGITIEAQQVGGSYTTYAIDDGLGAEILSDASASTVKCYIAIVPGTIVPTMVFKPMICTKSQWNLSTAFVPCGKTNPELTKDLTDLSYVVAGKAQTSNTLNPTSYGSYAITQSQTDTMISGLATQSGSYTKYIGSISRNSTTGALTATIYSMNDSSSNSNYSLYDNGYAATSQAINDCLDARIRCNGYDGSISSGSNLNSFLTPGVYISDVMSCSSSYPQPSYYVSNTPPDFLNFSESVVNFKFRLRLEVINPTTDSSTNNMMQRLYCFCTSNGSIQYQSFVTVYYRYYHYNSSGYSWTRWNAATNNNAFGRVMARGDVTNDFNTLYKPGKYWGTAFTVMTNRPSTGPTTNYPRWTLDVEEVMAADGSGAASNPYYRYHIKQTLYVVDPSNALTVFYRFADCRSTSSNQYGSVDTWYSWYQVSITAVSTS